MRKYFVISSVLLASFQLAFAQKMHKVDSIRIADLKMQLLKSKTKDRVNFLNSLAGEFQNAIASTDMIHKDSVLKYASLANTEAQKLDYKYGLAFSLYRLARYYMKYLKDKDKSEDYLQQAFSIAEKIKANEIIGWYYYDKWELKKAITYFKAANNKEAEADATAWLCYEYSNSGKYDEEGFKYCQRAVELADIKKTITPSWGAYISELTFQTMSEMASQVGDYESAINYLRQAGKYAKNVDYNMDWEFGRLYMYMRKNDSSVYYFEKAYKQIPDNRFLVKHTGTANLYAKNYERAAELLEKALAVMQQPEWINRNFPVNWKGQLYLELGEAYEALNKETLAGQNYQFALDQQRNEYNKLITKSNANKSEYQNLWDLMNISEGMSKCFYFLGNHDSAYLYLNKYTKFKDSVQNRNLLWRLNMQLSNFKKKTEDDRKTSQINLLNKNNQLKEQKLKQQATLRNSLIIGLILLLLLGIVIYRNLIQKRRNELQKQKLENEKKQTELEMQALRAQMNPHFIFNCLSSINRFILKNESKIASNYLTRFSRLMRMVLNNSQKPLISLDDELEMLELYLEMERLRFKNSFDYGITFLNTVDSDNVFIPPLLLQPFCENAIWHGLMNKEGHGRLDIELSMEDNILNCVIRDNGVGREKAEELKSKTAEKEKSMGLKITTERLALLNREKGLNTFYEIEDLKDENEISSGTKVTLKISFKQSVEEFA